MIDPNLIVAGASLLGSQMGTNSAQSANEQNLAFARETRDWQGRMANSAHVREMQDLKNAGLNPILTAGGGGSSTPVGAMATVEPTVDPNQVSSALASIAQQKLLAEQVKTEQTKQEVNKAEIPVKKATAIRTLAESQKTSAEIPKAQSHGKVWSYASSALDLLPTPQKVKSWFRSKTTNPKTGKRNK